MYAYNNPVNLSDPSGECPPCLVVAAALVPIISANPHVFIALGDMIIQDASQGRYLEAADKALYLVPGATISKTAFKFTGYALWKMGLRSITTGQALKVLKSVKPFSYTIDGKRRVGYYDPSSKIFVATEGDQIVNAFKTDAKYIQNLLNKKP